MAFPVDRPRRLRKNETMRRLVRETTLSASDFILPLFVCEGEGINKPIGSMPDVSQMSVDVLVEECKEVEALGIPAVILFGIPAFKDAMGSEAYNEDGIVQKGIRAIKKECKKLLVMTDVCMCEYTEHGHCGILKGEDVDNDETVKHLALTALTHVKAGADIVAPSDMMDGRVDAIREILDDHGFDDIPIMSYSVKYCSAFYGPFREAAESTPQFGDRKTYQMDPANRREGLKEAEQDIVEGADIIMVKPALPYLDLISDLKQNFDRPVAAYHVSGEYSMIMAADKMGWLDGHKAMMESLVCIKRAGADIIFTYYAKQAAKALKEV
ncbi:Porphobilinogen synthase [Denitrovibrio acetiphilus DSM 12809]|uniref:Delta-aminolevulinic acid dehydratase n=1 Tax=Denitrovibrio acetiphilus (strain DSM 12809 / NBRC 114555 / N2460) TaxID=522772 RepID=D4H6I6_DENA2|nr:porphobilinogen synthase [Denitrovibrio acetiphilus]ADD69660.1 Porphobilinogen synthase [Denitrovibrio acetiphilus DSM 12809]